LLVLDEIEAKVVDSHLPSCVESMHAWLLYGSDASIAAQQSNPQIFACFRKPMPSTRRGQSCEG
jgi:hypothetical protein